MGGRQNLFGMVTDEDTTANKSTAPTTPTNMMPSSIDRQQRVLANALRVLRARSDMGLLPSSSSMSAITSSSAALSSSAAAAAAATYLAHRDYDNLGHAKMHGRLHEVDEGIDILNNVGVAVGQLLPPPPPPSLQLNNIIKRRQTAIVAPTTTTTMAEEAAATSMFGKLDSHTAYYHHHLAQVKLLDDERRNKKNQQLKRHFFSECSGDGGSGGDGGRMVDWSQLGLGGMDGNKAAEAKDGATTVQQKETLRYYGDSITQLRCFCVAVWVHCLIIVIYIYKQHYIICNSSNYFINKLHVLQLPPFSIG